MMKGKVAQAIFRGGFMRVFLSFAGFVLCLAVVGSSRAMASDISVWPKVPNAPLHWQLQGDIDVGAKIRVVDSDLFETPARQVREWRDAGIFPICYINVGAVEDWREDYAQFPSEVIGNPYWGWDGENWLDIGRFERFSDVILARFDLCRDKGFLGIEPDNIDAYEADYSNKETGFNLTREDQIRYVSWLIDQAHARGLAIGQKNASELVPELVGRMDFALLESAYRLGFMDEFSAYRDVKKPVFAVEYIEEGADPKQFCPKAGEYGFQGIVAGMKLDGKPENCP